MNPKLKMSKSKTILFCIAVFLSSYTVMHDMPMVVAADLLYAAFPDSPNMITLILSGPALLCVGASLVAGMLLKKMSTKMELIIAGVLMTVFGIFGCTIENAAYMAFTACMLGVAAGFANTAGMAIIGEVYLDEHPRSKIMGYYNAVMSACGMALSFGAGVLATQSWQTVYRSYWFSVPMLLLTIFCLPNIKPEDRVADVAAEGETESGAESSKGYGKKFWVMFVSMFIFYVAYCPFFTFIAVYVAEHNLGTPVFTGTLSTLTTVGSMVTSAIFGIMFAKMRRGVNYLYVGLPIVIMLWLWLAPSTIGAVVGALVWGACYGGVFTFTYAYAACCVPPSKMGGAMGLMTACYGIAIFVGTNLASWCMQAAGGLITPIGYPVAIGCLAVSLVIEIICIRKDNAEGFLK